MPEQVDKLSGAIADAKAVAAKEGLAASAYWNERNEVGEPVRNMATGVKYPKIKCEKQEETKL